MTDNKSVISIICIGDELYMYVDLWFLFGIRGGMWYGNGTMKMRQHQDIEKK